ncbi:unnamed protein product [Rotaria sp. Silwood1]|nr:unnamed protein product [Rotaria sp. Silwood1]CAF1618830.1 unnamed protein product [Rotaria sp. Silwood1]
MNSILNKSSIENLSLCVYIGNTCSFDDDILINYCSQYGRIISCTIDKCPNEKRIFCDFRIIEFSNKEELEKFLHISLHKIDLIELDIKLYKNLLDNIDILNIDRKIFIGPIFNLNDINIIIEFYKLIDQKIKSYISKQNKQIYILIEFSNREFIRTIIKQKTIPKIIDNQILNIHTAINPKEYLKNNISLENNHHQIMIYGLNDYINENILMDYFDKRATVVACKIIPNDPKCAIIEFENEKFVQKFLDLHFIYLNGTTLSLNKVSDHFKSSININQQEYTNDYIDYLLETTQLNLNNSSSTTEQNQTFLSQISTVQQFNCNQQEKSISNIISQSSSLLTESIDDSSPDINECGWTSPPRNVINHISPINQIVERLSTQPCLTTMNINSDSLNQSRIIEIDEKKSIKNLKKNLLKFIEEYENEIDQIKDEYMIKYTKDRTNIEHEINRLINDERISFDRVNRYLYDNQRHSDKSYENKRRYI